jgi:hypothetical protein
MATAPNLLGSNHRELRRCSMEFGAKSIAYVTTGETAEAGEGDQDAGSNAGPGKETRVNARNVERRVLSSKQEVDQHRGWQSVPTLRSRCLRQYRPQDRGRGSWQTPPNLCPAHASIAGQHVLQNSQIR